MDLFIIAIASILITAVADLVTMKTPIGGIDFMMYSPWVVALTNVYAAVALAFVLLLAHALVRNRIAHYILLLFPAQVSAIAIGAVLGVNGFWLALIAYFTICTIIAKSVGALGGKYFGFVALAVVFNVVLYSARVFL
ncbi:MAG TPA: hypothetical protein VI968_03000 [archaeon]|nr:hypothetical protein [archaeon]